MLNLVMVASHVTVTLLVQPMKSVTSSRDIVTVRKVSQGRNVISAKSDTGISLQLVVKVTSNFYLLLIS